MIHHQMIKQVNELGLNYCDQQYPSDYINDR